MFIEHTLAGLIILTLLLSCVADEGLDYHSPLKAKTAHILRPHLLLTAHAITNNLVGYCTAASFALMK